MARHLLLVRRQTEADAATAPAVAARLGPWAAGDSRRLWGPHTRSALLAHPEGGEGAALRTWLTVLGPGSFQVGQKRGWSGCKPQLLQPLGG